MSDARPKLGPLAAAKRRRMIGLGDVVETAVKPAVKIIRLATGHDLSTCGGCKNRKDWLNRAFPFNVNPAPVPKALPSDSMEP